MRKAWEREGNETDEDSETNIDFGKYVEMSLTNEHSWLESGQWYAIVSPNYKYWYIGYANRVNGDNVNISFLQQIEEGSNIFKDEKCVEDVPVTQMFHKLTQAPVQLSRRRSSMLKMNEFDYLAITENYERYL